MPTLQTGECHFWISDKVLKKGWCFQCRYPHPGERKNEWSFSGEDDLKQWVLTADSDWGEGYRWLLILIIFHFFKSCFNDEVKLLDTLPHVKCCTVWDPPIRPLCPERRTINKVKLDQFFKQVYSCLQGASRWENSERRLCEYFQCPKNKCLCPGSCQGSLARLFKGSPQWKSLKSDLN